MKVKSILRKVNVATTDIPIYIENSGGFDRKRIKWTTTGKNFEECDKEVTAITVNSRAMTIYYKD